MLSLSKACLCVENTSKGKHNPCLQCACMWCVCTCVYVCIARTCAYIRVSLSGSASLRSQLNGGMAACYSNERSLAKTWKGFTHKSASVLGPDGDQQAEIEEKGFWRQKTILGKRRGRGAFSSLSTCTYNTSESKGAALKQALSCFSLILPVTQFGTKMAASWSTYKTDSGLYLELKFWGSVSVDTERLAK